MEDLLKLLKWNLFYTRASLLEEDHCGNSLSSLDEWSTPIVNLDHAMKLVDKMLEENSNND
jgi:hypothetical protein